MRRGLVIRWMVYPVLAFAALCVGPMREGWAEEPITPVVESAVINSPATGWELTKDVVSYLEPGADWIVTFTDGPPIQGFSGALYTFTSKGWPLASVRAGYGLTDPVTYGSLAIDLPGLAGRFLPDAVKHLSPGVVTAAATYASKYVRVGPVAGYRWDDKKPVWGVSLGAVIDF